MSDVLIKWPGCVLVFTEDEFRELLKEREDLWVIALRRGKHYAAKKEENRRVRCNEQKTEI
jgi:uncharacterized protein with PhoU and TrkA domain